MTNDVLIQRKQEQRSQLLRAIYGFADGKEGFTIAPMNYIAAGSQVGVNKEETLEAIRFFVSQELLVFKPASEAIALTHKGIVTVEENAATIAAERNKRLERLPDKITAVLESAPDTLNLKQVRAALPEYRDLDDADFFKALKVLSARGIVSTETGAGSVGQLVNTAYHFGIANRGRINLSDATKLNVVALSGEVFEIAYQRKESAGDGVFYLFTITDRKKTRGLRHVMLLRSGAKDYYAQDYDERIEIVRLNAIRRAFDSNLISFDAPFEEDKYIELKLHKADFRKGSPAADDQIREFIKRTAYWLGYKLSSNVDRYFVRFDHEQNLEYLNVSRDDVMRNLWLLEKQGYLESSNIPGNRVPTVKLIEEMESEASEEAKVRLVWKGEPPRATPGQPKTCIGAFGNKYSLGKVIGNGGAGVVYEARTEDNDACAIKVLSTQQSSKIKRFKNEIAYCFRNQHKNTIAVWDFGQTDGKTFYVMPLYSSTLRKLILTGIEQTRVLDFLSQVLNGVEAAHQNGVCHRDLKPENILFDQATETLVVADFGIAKFKEEELQTAVETSAQEGLANFQYSAPEQRVRERVVDQRADIYALGLILSEMFTGEVPQGTGFKRIASVAPRYSYLDSAIDSMVQQTPENRPESISDVRRLLRLSPGPVASKSYDSNPPALPKVLSAEERDRIFEEADIDFAITQGMQQTFIVSFHNKSESGIIIKKLKLSYNGIKILEAPPPDKKPWQLGPSRSQDFSWGANPDPVTNLMQIQGEWNKPFNLNLEIFIQIEILGRIKTFENRKIFCQVEPSARRIWHRI
jgi:serine/threonine protein kinase